MANFDLAYKATAGFEGGYTNDPDDNGNWTSGRKGLGVLIGTNLGIAAPVLAAFLGRTPTVEDMKNLQAETVKGIYRKNYWSPMRGDEINNQDEANSIYDACVNSGCVRAIKMAQLALQMPLRGVMNDATLRALNNKI